MGFLALFAMRPAGCLAGFLLPWWNRFSVFEPVPPPNRFHLAGVYTHLNAFFGISGIGSPVNRFRLNLLIYKAWNRWNGWNRLFIKSSRNPLSVADGATPTGKVGKNAANRFQPIPPSRQFSHGNVCAHFFDDARCDKRNGHEEALRLEVTPFLLPV